MYSVLATEIKADASGKEEIGVRKSERKPLREVMIKIGWRSWIRRKGLRWRHCWIVEPQD